MMCCGNRKLVLRLSFLLHVYDSAQTLITVDLTNAAASSYFRVRDQAEEKQSI